MRGERRALLKKWGKPAALVLGVILVLGVTVLVSLFGWRLSQLPPEWVVLDTYLPVGVTIDFSEAGLPERRITELGAVSFVEEKSLEDLALVAGQEGAKNTLSIAWNSLLYQTEFEGTVYYHSVGEGLRSFHPRDPWPAALMASRRISASRIADGSLAVCWGPLEDVWVLVVICCAACLIGLVFLAGALRIVSGY